SLATGGAGLGFFGDHTGLADSGRPVRQRQAKGEGASLPGRAPDANFAAKKASDFPTDRQAQPGAAVAATGSRVRLLERLEDDLELVSRDADAGVGHGECHDGAGPAQDRVVGAPSLLGQLDAQADLA